MRRKNRIRFCWHRFTGQSFFSDHHRATANPFRSFLSSIIPEWHCSRGIEEIKCEFTFASTREKNLGLFLFFRVSRLLKMKNFAWDESCRCCFSQCRYFYYPRMTMQFHTMAAIRHRYIKIGPDETVTYVCVPFAK